MKCYEYEVVTIKLSVWTGRAQDDYVPIIKDYGIRGWRFVGFTPNQAKPSGAKGIELVFEREVPEGKRPMY